MSEPIRVIFVEDSESDAELAAWELESAGLRCLSLRVETEQQFRDALKRGNFDVIISDFSMPTFDGRAALAIARREVPEVPFIFVSGTIGEDAAIQSLREGATDYVLKSSSIKRLAPAIARALREARERKERLRLAEEVRRSQKLEAIGRLAGGVAHDFNNILTTILGCGAFMRRKLGPDDPLRKDLDEIIKASESATFLTRQLLAFSRQQAFNPVALDLNAVITGMAGMLRRMIGEDIELSMRLDPELHPVKADLGQMQQVVMNLVVNARDAMPKGGRLAIATSNLAPDGASPGRVSMTFSDSGVGMDDETKERIFEPFFTTKGPGKGTGLGLSTVYGIVLQSGGSIEVLSRPARGTTFVVRFPQAEAGPAPAPAPEGAARPSSRSETVLLVEDEPAVRGIARRGLEEEGYAVLVAADAEGAFGAPGKPR